MGFFKDVADGFGKAVNKIIPKPKPKPAPVRPPMQKVGLPGDPAEIARLAFRNVGDAIVDTAKDVGRVTAVAVETTGEFIGDAEHFLKTGDWGRAVQKLQAEEADAEAKMWMARAAFDEALAVYVRTTLKRRSLSIIHEQTGRQGSGTGVAKAVPGAPPAPDVNPDLYGSTTTRMLDAAGLKVIGDAGRTIQTIIPVRMPMSLLMQQKELSEARRALKANISAFRNATAATSRATADVIEQTEIIAAEVEALEADFIRRGVDADTGATRDMADASEAGAKLDVASSLLEAGLPPENVARATELALSEVQGLLEPA